MSFRFARNGSHRWNPSPRMHESLRRNCGGNEPQNFPESAALMPQYREGNAKDCGRSSGSGFNTNFASSAFPSRPIAGGGSGIRMKRPSGLIHQTNRQPVTAARPRRLFTAFPIESPGSRNSRVSLAMDAAISIRQCTGNRPAGNGVWQTWKREAPNDSNRPLRVIQTLIPGMVPDRT